MDHVARPAVPVSPKWTPGTGLTLGVVDAFLMGATDDAVSHYDRFHPMPLDEFKNLAANRRVGPNIVVLGEPAFQWVGFSTFRREDGNDDFCSAAVIRAVERHRRHRVSPETPAFFLSGD